MDSKGPLYLCAVHLDAEGACKIFLTSRGMLSVMRPCLGFSSIYFSVWLCGNVIFRDTQEAALP